MTDQVHKQRPTICLCMIVRDESTVIERCLNAVRGLIDRWMIIDTGSTDDTCERIYRSLEGIRGELHERTWVDFGHNRSELMALARDTADYLLLIDADMVICQDGDLPDLTADGYLIRQGSEEFDYRNLRLVRGDIGWRYVGATHEYIQAIDTQPVTVNLDAIRIDDRGDGGSKADKFERDERLLSNELQRDPTNSRALFYLAQTLRDRGRITADQERLRRARDLYVERGYRGGWAEEAYCAQYQAGVLSEELGEWGRATEHYLAAYNLRPERLEAVHDLTQGLIARGQYHTAHRFTSIALARSSTPPADVLFVTPWVHTWGLLFQHTIAAFWTKDYDGAIAAAKLVLACDALPETHRRQTQRNLAYALRERLAVNSLPRLEPRSVSAVGTTTHHRAA